MKRALYVLWACAVAVCLVMCGVTVEMERRQTNQEFRLNLRFGRGDIVDLRLGGKGQIIKVWGKRDDAPYLIRIRTEDGFEERWMSEFEVKS